MKPFHSSPPPRRQQGIALALVLVLLVASTLIGLTAMRTARIQEQLAGATFDRVVARAAGDATMVDAHLLVYRPDFEPIAIPTAPIYTANDGWTIEAWRKLDFDWLSVKTLGDGRVVNTVLQNVKTNPTYTVERLPVNTPQRGRNETALRATVRATGGRASTEHYSMSIILLPK